MSIFTDAIGDFVATTVENYLPQKGKFTDVALTFPEYQIAHRFFTANKSVTEGAGPYTFQIRIANDGQFRTDVGAYDEDQPERVSQFVGGSINETGFNIATSFDVMYDRKLHSPDKRVKVDYIKAHIDSLFQAYFEGMEVALWTFPSTSATRGLLGIPYWITHSTTADFGFNGLNPTGHSSGKGGIDASTYRGWRNGTGEYVSLDDEDGFDLLSTAMDRCNFRSVGRNVATKDSDDVSGKWSLVTNYDNKRAIQRYLRTQNDDIGNDAGKFRSDCYFRSTEVLHSWALSLDTLADGSANPAQATTSAGLNPIYGICWDDMKFHVSSGVDMMLTQRPAPLQRHVRLVNIDTVGQLACHNVRKQFVLTNPS